MNAQNNNNINIEAIIERLQKINLDVAKVEEVCEYGGNCWSTPSADITNLIHDLEEMIKPNRNPRWKIIKKILSHKEIDALLEVGGPNYFDDLLRLPYEVIRRAKPLIAERRSYNIDDEDFNLERVREIQTELDDLLDPYVEVVCPDILVKYIEHYPV